MQTLQVSTTVIVIEKARHAVVPALYHVLRNAGEINSWESGHGGSVNRPAHPHSPHFS
jgi:hypothetical protein